MREFWEYIKAHALVFTGGATGLIVGIMILTLGFWPTLLLGITTTLGALLTGKPEARDTLKAWTIGIFKKIFKGK